MGKQAAAAAVAVAAVVVVAVVVEACRDGDVCDGRRDGVELKVY
jgi:hypothetical protein